jgi:hypothetical protein
LNTHFARVLAVALGLILTAAAPARGQTADGGPDPSQVRVRIGPVWMNPTISMPNLGVDTNVFNDPPTVVPRRDFTLTITPKADVWLRAGRTWFLGTMAEDIVWYQKYSSERSANQTYSIGWKAPLNRLVLGTNASWLLTRSRPGFEIDARAERYEPTYSGSFEVRGFSKTYIGARGAWKRVSFDENAEFKGISLQEQLDRTSQSAAVSVRHAITPLTSIIFSVGRSEDRFKFEPSRDATSDDYAVEVTFDPAALLKGSARIGYTAYRTKAADLEDYNGITSSVALSYTLLGSTRFAVTAGRSIQSSYDINQPFYLQTGVSASLAQQIFGPIDAVGRLGGQRLEYRTRTGTTVEAPDRTDHIRTFGGGVGFRMGQDLRLGFNIDKERRTSVIADREYEGLRYGTAVTYGP